MSDRHAWRKSKTAVFHIYVLVDPRDGLPHYVGCTMNPRTRFYAHLGASYSEGNRRRCEWVKELLAAGLKPKMMGLAKVKGYAPAIAVEKKWIEKGFKRGWPLLNGQKPRDLAPFELEPYVEETRQ
jgi:hypothetical protein